MRFPRHLRALVCGFVVIATPGLAQQGTPVAKSEIPPGKRISMEVHSHAFDMLGDLLEPHMKLRLLLVAKQKIAANTCDGFEVDEARSSNVMNTVLAPLFALTEDGQNNLAVDIAMHAYGVILGGELAQAAYDRKGYCAFAAELREELSGDTEGLVSIWK